MKAVTLPPGDTGVWGRVAGQRPLQARSTAWRPTRAPQDCQRLCKHKNTQRSQRPAVTAHKGSLGHSPRGFREEPAGAEGQVLCRKLTVVCQRGTRGSCRAGH